MVSAGKVISMADILFLVYLMGASVYSAELTAMFLVIQYINNSDYSHFIIYSDLLLSVFPELHGRVQTNLLLCLIIHQYMNETNEGNDVTFCVHIGIHGNELAE